MDILFENYVSDEHTGNDLNTIFCGRQECPPLHSYGPFTRNYFLIHFILSGKGTYYHDGNVYELNKNEGFLIFPGDETTYTADEKEPWHYVWIAFNGTLARALLARCGLTRTNPVFICENPERFKREFLIMIDEMKDGNSSGYAATGRLYILLAHLFKRGDAETSATLKIFNNAVGYIGRHYNDEITVDSLAKTLFIDRSHLFRVFKAHAKQSPSRFISDYRMKKAAELLIFSGYSITEIARHCGYPDASAFCKTFKKTYAVSAKDYRTAKKGNQ